MRITCTRTVPAKPRWLSLWCYCHRVYSLVHHVLPEGEWAGPFFAFLFNVCVDATYNWLTGDTYTVSRPRALGYFQTHGPLVEGSPERKGSTQMLPCKPRWLAALAVKSSSHIFYLLGAPIHRTTHLPQRPSFSTNGRGTPYPLLTQVFTL